MEFTVKKTINFEASHRLTENYPGKCKHLHGHSWECTIEIGKLKSNGTKNPKVLLDNFSMIYDFSKFKIVKDWIDKNWDHATLINSNDKSLEEWLIKNKQRYFKFNDQNPTSEVLAIYLFENCSNFLKIKNNEALKIISVTVNETCTSAACIRI